MALLLFAAVALIGFRLWMRLQDTDSALEELTQRVSALEHARPTTGRPTAETEQPRSETIPPVASPVAQPPPPAVPQPARPAAAAPPSAETDPPRPTPPLGVPQHATAPQAARVAAARDRATSTSDREALESRIGSRWLLYVGVVAMVIGVSYFEKLAIDNHWVNETWRTIQGGVAGLLFVAGGLRIVKKGYRLYGQILAGTGIAILYVSTYAAFNLYHLISHPTAFALMFAITALGAWLADSQPSQGLALVAVSGGFATPFLLPTGADAETALFAYDALLIAGTVILARRRDWPALNAVSYVLTALTFLSWAAVFNAPSKYITTELFLTLFCVMFLYALRGTSRSATVAAKLTRALLWTAPFGYYVLSLANLNGHNTALLSFLVLLSLVGVIVGSYTNAWVRLVFWFAAVAPLLIWTEGHAGRPWQLAAGLSAWTGVYVLHLAGLFNATFDERDRFTDADVALLHANALIAYLGAYLLLEPIRGAVCAPLAAALAVMNLGFAYLVRTRRREQALHFVALASTLVTIAVALQFHGAWITNGWAIEGVLIAWLGLRERRAWLRSGGLALFGAAIVRLMAAQLAPPSVGDTLLLNSRALSGLFVSALTYVLAYLHARYREVSARETEVAAGLVLAKLLLLAVSVTEIFGYWERHIRPPFEPEAQALGAALVTGAVIVWLGLRRQQEWVRAVGSAILAIATFALFSIQLQNVPAGYVTALNGRAVVGALAIAILYGLVVLHRRLGGHLTQLPANIAVLTTTASLLTLSLLTSEIDAFWAARGASSTWSVAREGLQSMAWAAIGGFLIWHGLSARRRIIRGLGAALLLVGVVRLARLHFAEPPLAYAIVTNARVMTSIVVIALLYGLASLYERDGATDAARTDPEEGRSAPAAGLRLIANALTLTLLTGEITAYWHVFDVREVTRSASANMHFAREMMLSITWAVYATMLVIVGLMRKYAPIRYFAMTVFAVTIVKVFAVDLAELDRIYRVLSIIGLGVTLLVTSYLYQKLSATNPRVAED